MKQRSLIIGILVVIALLAFVIILVKSCGSKNGQNFDSNLFYNSPQRFLPDGRLRANPMVPSGSGVMKDSGRAPSYSSMRQAHEGIESVVGSSYDEGSRRNQFPDDFSIADFDSSPKLKTASEFGPGGRDAQSAGVPMDDLYGSQFFIGSSSTDTAADIESRHRSNIVEDRTSARADTASYLAKRKEGFDQVSGNYIDNPSEYSNLPNYGKMIGVEGFGKSEGFGSRSEGYDDNLTLFPSGDMKLSSSAGGQDAIVYNQDINVNLRDVRPNLDPRGDIVIRSTRDDHVQLGNSRVVEPSVGYFTSYDNQGKDTTFSLSH